MWQEAGEELRTAEDSRGSICSIERNIGGVLHKESGRAARNITYIEADGHAHPCPTIHNAVDCSSEECLRLRCKQQQEDDTPL